MSCPSPLFSVVIPTFNRAALLPHAIRSVLDQSDGDYEILVVDDGSTDETATALQPFADQVRLLRQSNAGPAAAKNHGIRQARGRIIGFLDSDDAWEPDTLAGIRSRFDRQPQAGLISVMAREVEADGRRSARVYGKRSPGDEYRTTDLLWGDAGGCSWYFVRREPLETVGGFDPSLRSAEECDLAIRLSFHTRLFAWRAPQLLRRVHADNLTDDVALNARSWIAVVEKLQRDQPEFAQRHPWTIRRTLAKERMRWARHLLTHAGDDRDAVAVARRELLRSLRGYPFARAISYLGWAWIAPRCYRKFRQRELRLRRRR